MQKTNLDNEIECYLSLLTPEKTIFFTGAGISMDEPTRLPSGDELSKRILRYAFLEHVAVGDSEKPLIEVIQEIYCKLNKKMSFAERKYPRLEMLMEKACFATGPRVLSIVLKDIRAAYSNNNHQIFARHLQLGGRHITANFDTCIEKCMPDADRNNVVHFHGKVDELKTMLSEIANGFPAETEDKLLNTLTKQKNSILIVAGYSGRDFFDVDPFFLEKSKDIACHIEQVIWIEHSSKKSCIDDYWVADKVPPMFLHLQKNGIKCIHINCDTNAFLNKLDSNWNYCGITIHSDDSKNHISEEAKTKNTLELLYHMGLNTYYWDLTKKYPLYCGEDWILMGRKARCAWQKGHYRKSMRFYILTYNRDINRSKAKKYIRVANCQYTRGAMVRALIASFFGKNYAGKSEDSNVLFEAVDMQLQVFRHIKRCPDLRLLFYILPKKKVLDEAAELLTDENLMISLHAKNQMASAIKDLRGENAIADQQGFIDAFIEYEDLSAWLDYEYSKENRKMINCYTEDVKREKQKWIKDFAETAEILGKHESACCLPKISGAPESMEISWATRQLQDLDITIWHKFRIMTYFVLKKLKHKIFPPV
jgi:hypothetical protein